MMITKSEFLYRADVDQQTLDIWIAEEWLAPQKSDTDVVFTEQDLARAMLILDLLRGLGVNREGVGVILDLLDQVHGLRNALAGKLGRTQDQLGIR